MTNGNEMWMQVRGYEQFYEISNLGNIRSFVRRIEYPDGRVEYRKARRLSVTVNKYNGYCYVGLVGTNREQKSFRFHRLVAQHFIPNPTNEPEVNHEDFDKQNNGAANLKWCDRFYQNQHSAKKPGRKWGLTGMRRMGKDNFKSRPVTVLDLAGNIIGQYESGNLAAKDLGCQQAHVSACCRGTRTSHKNYQFRFTETI